MAEVLFTQSRKCSGSSERLLNLAGDSSIIVSEDQLQCSVCLDVFTDPVTTPCGHNFCKICLSQHWNKSLLCFCPLCQERFTIRPEIKINITLREVVDQFKKKRSTDDSDVYCDICIKEKHKALKSCLDCGVSYCESHLEPHFKVSNFQKHKLINPVKNLNNYICEKHERPLELFCKDDQISVCQFCTEANHKNHKLVPIEEESKDKKNVLMSTQTVVKRMIQNRLKKIQEIKDSVEVNKRNTEREKSESVELFRVLIGSIGRSQAELIGVMEGKQKAAEKQAEEFIQDLQKEIIELKRRETELEQLVHTEEHLNLLQVYPFICRPPHTNNWTKISINTDLNVDDVRKTLSELQKTLNSKLTDTINEKIKETVDLELKRIQQYAVDVTLDPDTAHPNLILSENRKEVSHKNKKHRCPDTPKRFTNSFIILGEQSFSSGRFYYEIQVGNKPMWDLGVCRESVNRKKETTLSPQNGFWTVILRNENQYKACEGSSVLLSLRTKPQNVGVFVDYEKGVVSFYDVENRSNIYSFTGQSFTEKIYPYFCPCNNDGGKNSAPLIIPNVRRNT